MLREDLALSPTPRAALLLAAAAVLAAVAGPAIAALAVVVLLGAFVVDARAAGRPVDVARHLPATVARGVPAEVEAEVRAADGPALRRRLRQVVPPGLELDPPEGGERLAGTLLATRRGRHLVPPVAVRSRGPLGLATWDRKGGGEGAEVLAYPDIVAARRLAEAVRTGRLSAAGLRRRGPLGLGTEFERVREYAPDDDVRQINWRATARLGRPMSNEYRVERDRDVLCVVDAGRLMASPVADRTRLDVALDAAAAVALVADVLGDRCGTLAFDDEVRRRMRPRRGGGAAAIRLLFDLEPRQRDADHELAFRLVREAKRAWVLVLTDLLDEAAARSLVAAIPVLARSHAVAVASVLDPDVTALSSIVPERSVDAYAAAAALEVFSARDRTAAQVRAAGAEIVEAQPDALAAACVRAYLTAKARARL